MENKKMKVPTTTQLLEGHRFLRIGTDTRGEGLCDCCSAKIGIKKYNKNDGLCDKCVRAKHFADYILEQEIKYSLGF